MTAIPSVPMLSVEIRRAFQRDLEVVRSALATARKNLDARETLIAAQDVIKKERMAVQHLRRILCHPRRTLGVADVLGDERGLIAADGMLGNDDNWQTVNLARERLEEIRQSNRTADLVEEEAKLLQIIQIAAAPAKQVQQHHAIATRIREFIRRIKETMPKFSSHLDSSVKMERPDFSYFPPDGFPSWKIE